MSATLKKLQFGEFVDRDTMRFVRDYPHPVERAWTALTTMEELRAWWVPFTVLELRAGGRFEIEAPGGNRFKGTLSEYEPPRLINFNGLTRFELFERDGGCRMVVTLKRWPNGWSPLQLAGFHAQFDQLALLLAGFSKAQIEKNVDTWRYVFPAYELMVRQFINQGGRVHYRVHFGPNSTSPESDSEPVLAEVARILQENPAMKVELVGYCDDPCSMDESLELAQARIECIAGYLESKGIVVRRMFKVGGMNGLHRIVPGDSEQGRAINRRVELRPVY